MAELLFTSGGPELFDGVTTLNLSANSGLTAEQLGRICAGLDAAGASGGTLTLTGLTPADAIGMAALTHLLAAPRSWTVTREWPVITQDTTFTVNGDGTWKLKVTAVGTAPTYLWQWLDPNNGWQDTAVTTAQFDNPSRNEGSVDPDIQRQYRCAVTDNAVTAYSTPIVLPVPLISEQPTGDDLSVGDPFSMECIGSSADGRGNAVVITWTKDGVLVPGANNQLFSITSVQLSDAGTYRCVLTLPNGAKTTSDPAVLTVS